MTTMPWTSSYIMLQQSICISSGYEQLSCCCHRQGQTTQSWACLYPVPGSHTQHTIAGLLHLTAAHAAIYIDGPSVEQLHHRPPAWHVQCLACSMHTRSRYIQSEATGKHANIRVLKKQPSKGMLLPVMHMATPQAGHTS